MFENSFTKHQKIIPCFGVTEKKVISGHKVKT